MEQRKHEKYQEADDFKGTALFIGIAVGMVAGCGLILYILLSVI